MNATHPIDSLTAAQRLYPAPGNRRAYLHQPCDDTIVVARPDLKLQLYPATGGHPLMKMGCGFVLLEGRAPVSFAFDRVEQRFDQGALPLLTQRVAQGGFLFTQEAFTTRATEERGVVMLRLTIWRQHAEPAEAALGFLVTRAPHDRYSSHPNDDYIEFEPWGAAWEQGCGCSVGADYLHDGHAIVALCRHTAGITVQPTTGEGALTWAFRIAPQRQTPETLEVIVPYAGIGAYLADDDRPLDGPSSRGFAVSEREVLLALGFEDEYTRQREHWLRELARAPQLYVPEPEVQAIYRTLTLNNLQFLGSSAESAACRPGQGGYNDFATVYAWEASHFLLPLAHQGYHTEVNRVLDYLLTTQHGHAGPEGEVSDVEGCFRPHIHWMNETAAVVRIFAEYVIASGDVDRLRRDAPALLRAARWIGRQRARTRDLAPDGSPALHYGLMPKGRPHDWPIHGHFVFTDAYTWSGLDSLARACALAGLPEAEGLRAEAADYRQCILTAVRRALQPHPLDAKACWVPCDLYEDPVDAFQTSVFCGPHALLGSGILDAEDPLIPVIEASLRASGCLNDHFAFRMRLMEDAGLRQRQLAAAGGAVDLYYVTFAEASWHRAWLAQGERAKAQATLYMTLAYALSRDLHLAQERFCPQLPWLLPWQPNASANGRILGMVLSTLCLVAGDTYHLLAGVPDAWFAARVPLGIDRLWGNGGPFSFRLVPRGDAGWHLTYSCHGQVPDRLVLTLPGDGTQRVVREIRTEGKREGTFTYL
jgi:hypothetical protein